MNKIDEYRKSIYGRPATIRTKLSLFNQHIAHHFRGQTIETSIEHCIKDWKSNDLSLGTIKILFSILKEFASLSYKTNIDTKRLKFKYFSNEIKSQPRLKVWDKEQVKTAMEDAIVKDPELYDVMAVALGTGIRRGEIFALTWEDIDFLRGEITVSKSLDKDTYIIGPTKTKQVRVIQMLMWVGEIFEKNYKPKYKKEHCFKTFNPNVRLKALAIRNSLPVITFHGLRHIYSSTLLESGISPKWVSQQLGHSRLTTTIDLYWSCFTQKQNLDNMYGIN